MRLVFVDQDLSDRALDASSQPDGAARESLFLRCNLEGTRFLGDFQGSDFLGCRGRADFREANVYACYWRGWRRPDLWGCQWPADIGWLHHEPVESIIAQRINVVLPRLPRRLRRKAREAMEAVRDSLNDWRFSWKPAWRLVESLGLTREGIARIFRPVFEAYPRLAQHFEELVADRVPEGGRSSVTLSWPDGAEVVINGLALPSLTEPSRHALKLWAQAEADRQAPGPHYCFIWQVLPMTASILPEPDAWLTSLKRDGF